MKDERDERDEEVNKTLFATKLIDFCIEIILGHESGYYKAVSEGLLPISKNDLKTDIN